MTYVISRSSIIVWVNHEYSYIDSRNSRTLCELEYATTVMILEYKLEHSSKPFNYI